jgi:hypothetical protein
MRQNHLPHNGNFFPGRRNFFPAYAYRAPPKARFPGIFRKMRKKIASPLKAFSAVPLSPFEAASSLMAAT